MVSFRYLLLVTAEILFPPRRDAVAGSQIELVLVEFCACDQAICGFGGGMATRLTRRLRFCPEAARRTSGEDAPAPRNCRASVRDHQILDGAYALPDEDAETGRHRNGATRTGLQSQTRHQHHRHRSADRGDAGIRRSLCGDLRAHPSKRPHTPRNPVHKTASAAQIRKTRKSIIQIQRSSYGKDGGCFETAWTQRRYLALLANAEFCRLENALPSLSSHSCTRSIQTLSRARGGPK